MKTDTRLILPAKDPTPLTNEGSVQFIGNASVLTQYGGMTILTDPTFIHRHIRLLFDNLNRIPRDIERSISCCSI